MQYVAEFETAVARAAEAEGADGVVCGHIHRAELRTIPTPRGSVLYANCGDWVESCTALAEHADGRLEVLRWADILRAQATRALEHASGDGSALPPPALAGRPA